jgi:integrase/recombinase XerD
MPHRFETVQLLRVVSGGVPAETLLADWDIWQLARGLADRTRSERARIITQAAKATGQHPAEFTVDALLRWQAGHSTSSTRLTYYRALEAWHAWLLATGHRIDNPMVGLPKPREPRRRPRPAATSGIERLLASGIRRRTKVMVLLDCYAGLRVSEIAKVRGEDVDHDTRTLRVDGKGGVVRWVPMHPTLYAYALTMPKRGWWFPSHRYPDRPIRRDTASTTISRAMQRAGVTGTAHSLRHWLGTESLAAGANLRVTQELLGHGNVATTQLYTLVRQDELMAAVERLPDVTRAQVPHQLAEQHALPITTEG